MTDDEGRLVARRYRLGEPIGSGGMGRVWQAWDTYLERTVAIKEVHLRTGPGATDANVRAMREARAAAKIDHKGIVTVHDVVEHDGRPWIVMKLINGPSLNTVLAEEGPLTEERAAEIGIQVLGALDAAHQLGVLHRDVKPGNIMLDGDQAVLTDFGIAQIAGATSITATGQVVGTSDYLAPERTRGGDATYAADLWAMGVTLYVLAMQRSPFSPSEHQSTHAALHSSEPGHHPVLGDLWPVIHGLLRHDPKERLSATAAIDMLKEVRDKAKKNTRAHVVEHNPPTMIGGLEAQPTDVPPTEPGTRLNPPPFVDPVPEETEPKARHADVTIDPLPAAPAPLPRKPPRRTPVLLVTGAVVLIAAIVATTLLLTSSSGSPTAPVPPLRSYVEDLGFRIGVPADWARTTSQPGEVSSVRWQGQQALQRVGPLDVQVQRNQQEKWLSALTYLSEQDRILRSDQDKQPYQKIALTRLQHGNGSELEYTHGSSVGADRYHVYQRAFVTGSGSLYVLTLSMYAADESTLGAQWEKVRPTVAAIRDSFVVDG